MANWLDDITEDIPLDELLHNIAGACYDNLEQFDPDLKNIICEPESFKVLEEAFLYLYEKYVLEYKPEEQLH